ncbi:MAG: hypothetical protein KDA24_01300 [Deltaproteobacteria bacterium]|nr:hypothetical protein [Deltaproteobacteria bacterium]
MRIDLSDPIPLSVDEAFLLLRDDMPSLVPYLDDCESITVSDRNSSDGDETVSLVNRWVADMSRVPAAVQKFATKELLSWDDHATWTAATKSCTWRLQPLRGTRLFDCSGTTAVVEEGGGARLTMAIDLVIYPENVPGVPRFIAKRIKPQAEKLISDKLVGNMRNLSVSIRRYHEARS